MRLAFVRSEEGSAVFRGGIDAGPEALLERLKISAKAGSSSKNLILELLRRGLLDEAVEWKFWDRPTANVDVPGLLSARVYDDDSDDFEREIARHGQPEVLWVEGPARPRHLEHVLALCPSSFKIVYSKDWKPWKIEGVEDYDLVLVDEERQAERLQRRFPGLRAGVWDKLIDYEGAHYPLDVAKEYDLCYVAYFRERKNHGLLLDALSKLRERHLRTVLIGGDRKGLRAGIESRARELGLEIDFVGEVPKEAVNAYVNRSRVGLMLAEKDAAPRVVLEYMAADVPVLVNADLRAGVRYVDERSGVVMTPERLHEGIAQILDNYAGFRPKEAFLERFPRDRVIERFLTIASAAGLDLTSTAAARRKG